MIDSLVTAAALGSGSTATVAGPVLWTRAERNLAAWPERALFTVPGADRRSECLDARFCDHGLGPLPNRALRQPGQARARARVAAVLLLLWMLTVRMR